MPFSEEIKAKVRRKSAFRCCMCQEIPVEIHHIHPQAEGGSDDEGNAAALCPTCHERYGNNPVWQKKIKEMRDHWHEVVKIKFPTRDDVDLDALNQATLADDPERMKDELRRYTYSLIESMHASSLPRLTNILVEGLYLDCGGHVPVDQLASEGPCSCERNTCVDSDHKVYCYFTKDQSDWVIRKRLYWRCYDEVIVCPRCKREHKRGHIGRDDVCGRPFLDQKAQSDAQ